MAFLLLSAEATSLTCAKQTQSESVSKKGKEIEVKKNYKTAGMSTTISVRRRVEWWCGLNDSDVTIRVRGRHDDVRQ